MKNVGKGIIGFLIVIGAMAIREVIAGVMAFIYGTSLVSSGKVAADDVEGLQQALLSNSDLILLFSAVGMVLWIIIFGIMYIRRRKMEGKALFEGSINGKRIVTILVMGLGLQFTINAVLGTLNLMAPQAMENYAKVIQSLGMGNSPISLLLVVLIAPIAEELIFRGTVFVYLRKNMSFLAANLIQALFFGLYHMNLIQGAYAFLLGLLFGWMIEKYGSVRECILLHMAVNLSGCVVGYVIPDVMVSKWWGLLTLLILAIVLLVFSIRTVKMEEIEQVIRSEERYDSAQNY